MDDAIAESLRLLAIGVFLLLAALASVRVSRGSAPDRRLAVAFGVLGGALLADVATGNTHSWLENVKLAGLLAFPYLLHRFASSFRPAPRRAERAAAVATGVVLAGTLALPDLPEAAAERPYWLQLYLVGVLAYWTVLSAVIVVRLWRAGRDHPTVTRRRMHLMSIAVVWLDAGMLVSGNNSSDASALHVAVNGVVLVSALTFLLGFSPPRTLRLAWRNHEAEAVRRSMGDLMRAETPAEVAAVLLPRLTEVVGARGAVLHDAKGDVVAAHGSTDDAPERCERIAIAGGRGSLRVMTSPYTPFFGPDDLDHMRALAAIGGLALERAELLERERRAAEEADLARAAADRASLAKNEFLSSMSHELRTPLNAILGFGQLLQLSELDGDDRDSADHIVRAGRHLLDLVNEVLDLSRVESGRLPLSPEAVRIDELVRESVDLMGPAAAERSIAIAADAASCEAHVHADRQRLKQVLLNLLSNALKYNHDGGEVAVSCSPQGEDRLRVSVRDTGPGIAERRIPALFEPFERLGADASGVDGTGLGLALSKRLVELMGGRIGVETREGEGSTFWLEFPLIESPVAALDVGGSEPAVATAAETERRTVLLIEDNVANVKLIEAILLRSRPGVTVMPAMQGTLGLELAARHRPDLVLLDLHLPDVPGNQVLHRLRANPATRAIPVVMLSADATPGQIQRLRDAGAAEYITKPLDVATFLATLDAVLELSAGAS